MPSVSGRQDQHARPYFPAPTRPTARVGPLPSGRVGIRPSFSHRASIVTKDHVRHLALLVCLTFPVLMPGPAQAHLDTHEQIARLTQQIEAGPSQATRASLYLRRGELHRIHGDWSDALADYQRARHLDPARVEVDLSLGRLWLDAGNPAQAAQALERFLAQRPHHVRALVTRAQARMQLDAPLLAAADYTRAIAQFQEPKKPLPGYYLARARALVAAGEAHLHDAIRGLDEGLRRLGNLATLQLYAVELELKQHRHDAALQRLQRVAAQSPRQERWLARRGTILEHSGRPRDALQTYLQALEALEALPPHRRATRAMSDLERRVHTSVSRLSALLNESAQRGR